MYKNQNCFPLERVINKQKQLRVSPNDRIRRVACEMAELHTGVAGVLDEKGRFVGILTEKDIVRKSVGIFKNVDKTLVGEIMTVMPIVVPASATAIDALNTMLTNGIRTLPVVNGHRLLGILDIRDLYDEVRSLMTKAIDERDEVISYFYGENYGGVARAKPLTQPFGIV